MSNQSDEIAVLRKGAEGAAKAAKAIGDGGWAVALIAACMADDLARAEAGELTGEDLATAVDAARAFIEENTDA